MNSSDKTGGVGVVEESSASASSSLELSRKYNRNSSLVVGGNDLSEKLHSLPLLPVEEEGRELTKQKKMEYIPIDLKNQNSVAYDDSNNNHNSNDSAFASRSTIKSISKPLDAIVNADNILKALNQSINDNNSNTNRWKLFQLETGKRKRSVNELLNNSNNNNNDLPESFHQEMLECFSNVTELLRFFYSIIGLLLLLL